MSEAYLDQMYSGGQTARTKGTPIPTALLNFNKKIRGLELYAGFLKNMGKNVRKKAKSK